MLKLWKHICMSTNAICFEIKTISRNAHQIIMIYHNEYCMLDSARSMHICCYFIQTQVVKCELLETHHTHMDITLITSTFLFLFSFNHGTFVTSVFSLWTSYLHACLDVCCMCGTHHYTKTLLCTHDSE